MSLTLEEQYLIELINRSRLDPAAEADRLGLEDLNRGLSTPVTSDAKQALAPNDYLHIAAQAHSEWMLSTNTFTHAGMDGSTPTMRIVAAGYDLTPPWGTGENISWSGTTGTLNLAAAIQSQHDGLFLSDGHRGNLLNTHFREIGVAQVEGRFTSDGSTYNTSMVTEKFALSGPGYFLTGVAYEDQDSSAGFSLGEGRGGIGFAIGSSVTGTAAAGGYALSHAGSSATVEVTAGTQTSRVVVDFTQGNVKLDAVLDAAGEVTTLWASQSMTLIDGAVSEAGLLGVADLALTGNAADNALWGNKGDNTLRGQDGDDILWGGDGDDVMAGNGGDDVMYGGDGNDRMFGGAGHDDMSGDDGADYLDGGTGNDTMRGGAGDDTMNGQSSDDLMAGNDGDDLMRGGDGNDRMFGGAGHDDMSGDDGADYLDGGTGNDTMRGGAGDDTMNGQSSDDLMAGNDGDDLMRGGDGNDRMFGGVGNDTLAGNNGDDYLNGGSGDDRLIGGLGSDTMTGGAGADVFVFAGAAHSPHGGARDTITDFESGVDRIDLSGFGGLSFVGSTYTGSAGEVRYNDAIGRLYVDTDGDMASEFSVDLAGAPALTVDDLIL